MSNFLRVGVLAGLASLAGACSSAEGVGDDEPSVSGENAIVSVAHTDVERQSIGNCWLYAHATWVESMNLRATNQAFDVSQSYWTYWDWFEKITGRQYGGIETKDGTTAVSTGGGWQYANNLVRRYGIIAEADFVVEDSLTEMSARQKAALAAIGTSLTSGALSTKEARRDLALVRTELDRAWSLSEATIAKLNTVFGADVSRTFESGSKAVESASIINAKSFKVAYPRRSSRGNVYVTTTSLSTAMNGWREVGYAWYDQRDLQIRVQKAMHAQAPVLISWFVDFNALESDKTKPLAGSFNKTTLDKNGPGRQGRHATVLEDYQVKLPSGEVLLANVNVTDKSKLAQALERSASIEFLQVKNSWGADRPDRAFAPGMPGYHNLYLNYLDGPVKECDEHEGLKPVAERGCTTDTVPLDDFVLPPGF
jgi:hypothetical protein